MKKIFFSSLFLGVFLFSCQPEVINMGEATRFYPPSSQLLKGIAYKFYVHNIPDNTGESPSTNINYNTYQFIQPDTLVTESYDAAMRIKWKNIYLIKNNQFQMIDVFYSNLVDTFKAQITNNIFMDWANNETSSDYKIQTKYDYQMLFSIKQKEIKDTVIANRPSKMIKSIDNYTVVSPSNDSISHPSKTKRIYAEGLGLFASYEKTETGMTYSELVEQMSLEDFKKQMNHGEKRIAYINRDHTLDNNADFKICKEELRILDYYNCDNPGQIQGGKGKWKRILEEELDVKKLNNESGYLTFRFVINCKGKAGRFVTEEADLDFQKKKFNKETVTHFFEIISKQKDWQTCNEKGERYDSYAYVTFKLQHGNLIEILP